MFYSAEVRGLAECKVRPTVGSSLVVRGMVVNSDRPTGRCLSVNWFL